MTITKRFLMLMAAVLITATTTMAADGLTSKVDPRIGTGGHGHTFMGADVPFGFVQLGPTQHNQGWDWCSGYHYSDSLIVGFGHLHLSGTGIGDLGDVSLLPTTCPKQREVRFSHDAERCRPGYYSVMLANGVHVELTATQRTGMHRYTWPADADYGYVVVNLRQGIGWDAWKSSACTREGSRSVSGHRFSKGWANDQKVFFAADFSQDIAGMETKGDSIAVLKFANTGEPLLVRVGLSAVDTDGARRNLQAELNHWNFRNVMAEADHTWEQELAKVKVSGATEREQRIFYTAMYHSMIAPSVFCDVDGRYRGADGQVHQGNFTNYTTLSLWDTYRAAHPLMTIIHPERQKDMAQTFLNIFEQQGKLPVWHLMGNETNCMVGNPGIPVLADLVLKGYCTDREAALNAMKTSALLDERGLDLLKKYGYLPYNLYKGHETVACGMEYALADWCVARVARLMKRSKDARLFERRAMAYKEYFDPASGFMRGKDDRGQWRPNLQPKRVQSGEKDYTEGNAWQYIWLVPHDVTGLVKLFGSEERFVAKLDSTFIVESSPDDFEVPDVTGLIGQYAHGNEPSHAMLYLYNYVGQPWKGARLIRQTLSTLYHDQPDGLSGNEDVGQMSAWYILSAMGLYQVEPCGGKYVLGSPIFDEATISVGQGRTFTVKTIGNSPDNIYIQSARLNGQPYTKSYVMFDDIRRGGMLELTMGPQPSAFGTKKADRP